MANLEELGDQLLILCRREHVRRANQILEEIDDKLEDARQLLRLEVRLNFVTVLGTFAHGLCKPPM